MLGFSPVKISPEWCEGGTADAPGKTFSFPLLES